MTIALTPEMQELLTPEEEYARDYLASKIEEIVWNTTYRWFRDLFDHDPDISVFRDRTRFRHMMNGLGLVAWQLLRIARAEEPRWAAWDWDTKLDYIEFGLLVSIGRRPA